MNLHPAKVALALACALLIVTRLANAQGLRANEGQVMEIDRVAREVTIRHGYLPELSMDPMTMVFIVPDPALLEGVRQGDYVRFKAGLVAGQFAVIAITPLKPKPKPKPKESP